jgi:hypothetical protein
MVNCNCIDCFYNEESLGKKVCVNENLELNINGMCTSKKISIFPK